MNKKGFNTISGIIIGLIVLSATVVGGFLLFKEIPGDTTQLDSKTEKILVFAESVGYHSSSQYSRIYPLFNIVSYLQDGTKNFHTSIGEINHYIHDIHLMAKSKKVAVNAENRIEIHDLISREKKIFPIGGAINNIVASHDEKKIAISSVDPPDFGKYSLKLLDVETGEEKVLMNGAASFTIGGAIPRFEPVAWTSPDFIFVRERLGSGGEAGALYALRLADNKLDPLLNNSAGTISPDGKFYAVITPSKDSQVCLGMFEDPLDFDLQLYEFETAIWTTVDDSPAGFVINTWSDDSKQLFYERKPLSRNYFNLAGKVDEYGNPLICRNENIYEKSQKLVVDVAIKRTRNVSFFPIDVEGIASGLGVNQIIKLFINGVEVETQSGADSIFRKLGRADLPIRIEKKKTTLQIRNLLDPTSVKEMVLSLPKTDIKKLQPLPNQKVAVVTSKSALIIDPSGLEKSEIAVNDIIDVGAASDPGTVYYAKQNGDKVAFFQFSLLSRIATKLGETDYDTGANYELYAPTSDKMLLTARWREGNCEIWVVKILSSGSFSNFLSGKDCPISEYGPTQLEFGTVVSSQLAGITRDGSVIAVLELRPFAQTIQYTYRFYDVINQEMSGGITSTKSITNPLGFINKETFLIRDTDEREYHYIARPFNLKKPTSPDASVPAWLRGRDRLIDKILGFNNNGIYYQDREGYWWYLADGTVLRFDEGQLLENYFISIK